MENYVTLKRDLSLTNREATAYFKISLCKQVTVNREKLAEWFGVKDSETVTRTTQLLVDKGLVAKEMTWKRGRKNNKYTKVPVTKDFIIIKRGLKEQDLTADELGLLIRLAFLKCNTNNYIICTKRELLKQLHMSCGRFKVVAQKLFAQGYISEINGTIKLTEEFFPVTSKMYLNSEDLNTLHLLAEQNDKFGKQAQWILQNDIHKQSHAQTIFDNWSIGLLTKPKIKNKINTSFPLLM